jgi:hypothetical protein
MSGHGDPNKSYAPHIKVFLGFTIALATLAFWLIIHNESTPGRVRAIHQERSGAIVNCCAETDASEPSSH